MLPKELIEQIKIVSQRLNSGVGEHPPSESAWPCTNSGRQISAYELQKFLNETVLPFVKDMQDCFGEEQ